MSTYSCQREFHALISRLAPLLPPVSTFDLYYRHHHVESVHLTSTGGRPLHPALAVVQTPSREYYILRDNGLEVGCEEEGVAGIWMRVLGCDTRGEPDGRAGVSLEELTAYIQNL